MTVSTIKPVGIGDIVRYFDEFGKDHAALVTAVHGKFYETDVYTQEECDEMSKQYNSDYSGLVGKPHTVPSLNVVCITKDEDKTDSYGRQIFRPTSVVHRSSQAAAGRFWENFLID